MSHFRRLSFVMLSGALLTAIPLAVHASQPTTTTPSATENPNNPPVQKPTGSAPSGPTTGGSPTTGGTQPAPTYQPPASGPAASVPPTTPNVQSTPAPALPTHTPTSNAPTSSTVAPPATTPPVDTNAGPAGTVSPAPQTEPAPGANSSESAAGPAATTATDPAVSLEPSYDRTEPPVAPPVMPDLSSSTRGDPDAVVRAHYAEYYRPASNPGRLYFGARAGATIAGGKDQFGGRGVVLRSEIGHTWNVIGYALGATVIAGAFQHVTPDDEVDQYPALFGGGPSLSLGRLSLLRRSFFDVRVAYDFLYGNVYRNAESHSQVAPHGPRLDIDLGLLALGAETRRRRHAAGATIGWQRLIGSLSGEIAPANFLTFGAVYKFS